MCAKGNLIVILLVLGLCTASTARAEGQGRWQETEAGRSRKPSSVKGQVLKGRCSIDANVASVRPSNSSSGLRADDDRRKRNRRFTPAGAFLPFAPKFSGNITNHDPDRGLPDDWEGTWNGKLTVVDARFGSESSSEPNLLNAKRFVIRPGVQTAIVVPISKNGLQSKVHIYPKRVPLTKSPLRKVTVQDDALSFVSPYQINDGAENLLYSMLEMEHARDERDDEVIAATKHRIIGRIPRDEWFKHREKFTDHMAEVVNRVRGNDHGKPYLAPCQEYQWEQQKNMLAGGLAAAQGMRRLLNGESPRQLVHDDWYKQPGATVFVDLNQPNPDVGIADFPSRIEYLRNHLVQLGPKTYESEVMVRQTETDNNSDSAVDVVSETVTHMTETAPGVIKVQFTKLVFNRKRVCEEKLVLEGTLYRSFHGGKLP
jgi:hypothetical protein